jgi:hypothetical protein
MGPGLRREDKSGVEQSAESTTPARTRRPGRAPASSPFSNTGVHATSVAGDLLHRPAAGRQMTQPGVTRRPSASISCAVPARLAADLRNPDAIDRDIAGEALRAGAVADRAAAKDDVVHLASPARSRPAACGGAKGGGNRLPPRGPMP